MYLPLLLCYSSLRKPTTAWTWKQADERGVMQLDVRLQHAFCCVFGNHRDWDQVSLLTTVINPHEGFFFIPVGLGNVFNWYLILPSKTWNQKAFIDVPNHLINILTHFNFILRIETQKWKCPMYYCLLLSLSITLEKRLNLIKTKKPNKKNLPSKSWNHSCLESILESFCSLFWFNVSEKMFENF